MKKLSRKFFERHPARVAKDLLGKLIVRKVKGGILIGKIVEVEAYAGKDDPGSHAYKNQTPRNSVMFKKAGTGYVYLCYGTHYLFNVVVDKKGIAGAVLIRAVEPIKGIDVIKKFRNEKNIKNLTNGPAKFTQGFNITKKFNNVDLINNNELFFINNKNKEKINIISKERIGIKQGLEKKWRFFIKNNEYVSKI